MNSYTVTANSGKYQIFCYPIPHPNWGDSTVWVVKGSKILHFTSGGVYEGAALEVLAETDFDRLTVTTPIQTEWELQFEVEKLL